MRIGLKRPAIASLAGVAVLVALIWFVGPRGGLVDKPPRLLAIAVVLAVGGAALAAARWGGRIAKMLRAKPGDAPVDVGPDGCADKALRDGLFAAIDTLKTSRIGTVASNGALYELPWYLVIGHPGAGKSSAVLNSGLNFPLAGRHGGQRVGGTRNCDWFFASEAVLLDTAGRYTTQNDDRNEWLALMKLIRRFRPRAPINGVVVAIGLTELVDCRSERLAAYACQIRERIHEIDETFGVQVPVYLVVTKLDLLAGFGEFFAHLDANERARVWGATLPHDQQRGFDAVRTVGQRFDALCRGLREIGDERLALQGGPVAAAFAFPLEFRTLKGALCRFVALLHEDDPYHRRPLLRGFYLTSALQQGGPPVASAAHLAARFGLAPAGAAPAPAPTSHGHFLRDLFREVVFPDRHLVARQTRPPLRELRLAGLAVGLVALALLSGSLTWSFVGNQKLIAAVQKESASAVELVASGELHDRLRGLVLLQGRLEELRRDRERGHPWQIGIGLYRGGRLEQALRQQYFAGVRAVMLEPVKAGLEESLRRLPAAGGVRPRAAHVSEARVETAAEAGRDGLPIIPLSGPPERRENRASAAAGRGAAVGDARAGTREAPRVEHAYNALKTYLMLHDQPRMEPAHLADQLPRHWRPWLEQSRGAHAEDAVVALAERLVAFYVAEFRASDLPLIENEQRVVEHARDALRVALHRLSPAQRAYNELKARANMRFAPLTLARILDGKDAGVVAGSVVVPGAFTREAWEQYFRDALAELSRGGIGGDDWVLAVAREDSLGSGSTADHDRSELEALYRADYARAWSEFLQGVAVLEQGDLARSAEGVARLADPQSSPIRLLLARVADETSWDNLAAGDRSLESGRDAAIVVAAVLSGEERPTGENVAAKPGPLGRSFASVHAIAGAAGDPSVMSGYLEQLARIRARLGQMAAHDGPAPLARQLMQATLDGQGSELAQALQYVDDVMLARTDEASRRMLRPILVRPLIVAYSALIPVVEHDLNEAWQREVYPAWRGLADKFPFGDGPGEALPADIARFAGEDGHLSRFVDRHLAGLVSRNGSQLVPRTWGNQGLRLNTAFLAGADRLARVGEQIGAAQTRFELQPVPTSGLSEITFELGSQVLRYRNGPQPWQEFTWPGDDGNVGARVQVVDFDGAASVLASHPGRMGFVRLAGEAEVRPAQGGAVELEWRDAAGQGGKPVRLRFRAVAGVNPLDLIDLRRLSLPERIAR